MTTKKKSEPPPSLDKKKNLNLSLSENISELTSVQPISIYFGGDSHIGAIIEVILKDAFPKCSITVDYDRDSILWNLQDAKNSFKKNRPDLCILLMNNMLFLPPTNFKARMDAGCAFIRDLIAKTSAKVICLYSPTDNYPPENFLSAGAKVIYHLPLPLRAFTRDFPAVMEWETKKDFEK
jgi:hypothetical protein